MAVAAKTSAPKKSAKAAAPPKTKPNKLAANEHSTVAPYLTVKGARAAVEFYKKAFGAKVRMIMEADDKKRLMHAGLVVNGAEIMLSDTFPEFGENATAAPPEVKTTTVTVHLSVDDTDKWWQRAVDAGAKSLSEPEDMFWGDRFARVRDPFGHVWSIGAPVKKRRGG